MSVGCLGVSRDVWEVSGGCLRGVWGVWLMCSGVWVMTGGDRWCLGGVWWVSGGCLGGVGCPQCWGKFVIFSQTFSIISKISYHTSPKHILFL